MVVLSLINKGVGRACLVFSVLLVRTSECKGPGKTRKRVGNMLPESSDADTCPDFSQFCHMGKSVSSSKLCFCCQAETYFVAGNNVSSVAKLENDGKLVSAANVSGNMFPRFARA